MDQNVPLQSSSPLLTSSLYFYHTHVRTKSSHFIFQRFDHVLFSLSLFPYRTPHPQPHPHPGQRYHASCCTQPRATITMINQSPGQGVATQQQHPGALLLIIHHKQSRYASLQVKERGCLFSCCALRDWTSVHGRAPPRRRRLLPESLPLQTRPNCRVLLRQAPPTCLCHLFPALSPLVRPFEVILDTRLFLALVITRSNPQLPKRTSSSLPPKGV